MAQTLKQELLRYHYNVVKLKVYGQPAPEALTVPMTPEQEQFVAAISDDVVTELWHELLVLADIDREAVSARMAELDSLGVVALYDLVPLDETDPWHWANS